MGKTTHDREEEKGDSDETDDAFSGEGREPYWNHDNYGTYEQCLCQPIPVLGPPVFAQNDLGYQARSLRRTFKTDEF